MTAAFRPEPIDVRLDRLTLHGVTAGRGPLALMFHGITGNGYVFLPVIERLAAEFRCIAFDQRGHGRSGKPAAGYAAADYAGDIAALVRHFDAGPALVIGHSLGARNGLVAAARHPELVTAVVALDFTPYIETEVFDALDARVAGGDQVFAGSDAACAYIKGRYARFGPGAVDRRVRYGMVAVAGGLRPLADPHAIRATSTGLREDLAGVLKQVQVPTLLVRGADSKLVSPAAWARTKALRPDLPAIEIPGVDHYIQEEDPEAVVRAIRSFWATLQR
jgi:2-(acetamidomethylene)succinate hydrolase